MINTIVVTGSSGFIGKHLVNALKLNNNKVIELDFDKGFDLTTLDDIKRVPKFDSIVHLAAKSFVPLSYEKPWEFYHNNYLLTLNVLELAKKFKAKVIFFSSYLYGEPEYLPINEKHPLKPHNPYAQTKLICEKLCEGYNRDFSVPIIIFRPFNVYGFGQNNSFLIPSILKQIKTGRIILKDPRPKRDFIHVEDVVSAVMQAIKFNQTNFEIFNLGSGTSISVKELVEIIIDYIEKKTEIVFTKEMRKGEILETVATIKKANDLLKWKPKLNINVGIQKLIKNDESFSSIEIQ